MSLSLSVSPILKRIDCCGDGGVRRRAPSLSLTPILKIVDCCGDGGVSLPFGVNSGSRGGISLPLSLSRSFSCGSGGTLSLLLPTGAAAGSISLHSL